MTIKDLISKVHAIDHINIQDSDGSVVYDGLCQDFRATCKVAYAYLDREVNCIRAYNDVVIILL